MDAQSVPATQATARKMRVPIRGDKLGAPDADPTARTTALARDTLG